MSLAKISFQELSQPAVGLDARLVATKILIYYAADVLVALQSLLVDAFELVLGAMQVQLPFSYQPRRAFFQVRAVAQILLDGLVFVLCWTDT
jgi:hypothetical protein